MLIIHIGQVHVGLEGQKTTVHSFVLLLIPVTGCSRTHSAVTLGDWSDPLDPDVETQTIYKQLLQGRDKLR